MVALGEPFAVRAKHQRMMQVGGAWEVEQGLKRPMNMRRREEVLASGDVSDLISRIIHGDRQMVRCADVLPRQNHIAMKHGIHRVGTVKKVVELQLARERRSLLSVQSPRWDSAESRQLVDLSPASTFAGTRVKRSVGPVWSRCESFQFGLDLSSAAEARIENFQSTERVQGAVVGLASLKLGSQLAVSLKPEKLKILQALGVEFGANPGVIDVFESKQELTGKARCQIFRHPCRVGMSEVEEPGRAWSEAGGSHWNEGKSQILVSATRDLRYGWAASTA